MVWRADDDEWHIFLLYGLPVLNKRQQMYLQMVGKPMMWVDAVHHCAMQQGSHLASVVSEAEMLIIACALRKLNPSRYLHFLQRI